MEVLDLAPHATLHIDSQEEARKPETCGKCHLGYDHPQYEIYMESYHGARYSSHGDEWNWTQEPWRIGLDFDTPTCSACHMSTLAKPS